MPRPEDKPFVMFGIHPLFGDYVDAIHACGGHLARVVMNVPEPERPAGQRFQDSLDRYHQWLERHAGTTRRVKVLWLEDYSPEPKEIAILGFRGTKALPLIARLKAEHGITFPPVVHPAATVSPMAELAEGVFIGMGAIIAPNARIGAFSLLNRGASIGHDTVLSQGVVVSPAATTGSQVHLGEGCVLGIGCTVLEEVSIGAGAYVAGGALVLRDVAPKTLVAGVPAVEKKTL
jgi:sugar O-acyltransferase (sialic acid O-acetyltransferase NeuD family)